ncbi:MAG: hypothetical protein KJ559_02450 [Nanoarchaeota archaeon]|nr:hypothetical protein [Nanoarchaeota archaeon]
MPNPRFLQTAERWMNKEVPSERVQPVSPVQKSQPLMNNVSYSFLGGIEGQAILDEYNQRVSGDYQGASALNVLSFADNVLKGSNPFAFVLLNKILTQKKMRIATPADLERALEKEAINLKGTYGDSGLVLRSESDPNEYLAKNLASQIKGWGYNVGGDTIMIPLAGIELVYDSRSPYDLAFRLTDSSEIFYAPQLNKINHRKKFNRADEKGLPAFEDSGSRTLHSNEEGGICRLCRDWDLDLDAGDWDLAYSDSNGRVNFARSAST